MKKIILVMTTVLAMLLIVAFTCYGQGIDACYQKNNGQLRILTHQKCDQGHKGNPKGDHDCDHDCDYTNRCKPSEIPITLGGAEGAEVPRICAGYVAGHNCTATGCPFISSCVSNVEKLNLGQEGQYKITFTKGFDEPICVFYMYPTIESLAWITYELGTTSEILLVKAWFNEYDYFDLPFNFICAEH
jgi:hypothetical protein